MCASVVYVFAVSLKVLLLDATIWAVHRVYAQIVASLRSWWQFAVHEIVLYKEFGGHADDP